MTHTCTGRVHPRAMEGLKLFNGKCFFEAHEELEQAWREESAEIRILYKGLLQAAVVYYHISRGNYNGASKVYARSMNHLNRFPEVCRGIRVGRLRRDMQQSMHLVHHLGREHMGSFPIASIPPVAWTTVAESNWTCDRCGHEMVESNCKVTCPNCGARFDCSDLNLHFD